MYHVMYVSTAAVPVSEAELKEMVSHFRRNNERDGITGLLLYSGDNYIQEIEGEEEAIKVLYDKIRNDFRHKNIITLADGEMHERLFSEWHMGFKVISKNELSHFKGYVNPMSNRFLDVLPNKEEESVITILKQFVEHNIKTINVI